ncbi:MAG: GIY-YIG nuclease family protein [Candidatus Aenigmarchaeota archaeon]|nr:GIY-YIG nuclease family protein [Candidatus Aenigmarchaeota archaeon]
MKGAYVLIVEVRKNLRKKIGKLGILRFKKGSYCYVGSGLGKALSLENRLKRHLRKKKKLKWHIDYLLSSPYVIVKGFVIFPSEKKNECLISKEIEKYADETIRNFGSSDCKCKGHLHYFKNEEKVLKLFGG